MSIFENLDIIEVKDRKGFINQMVNIDNLKEEIIKQVKLIRQTTPIDEISSDRKLCMWININFNITEEDLK